MGFDLKEYQKQYRKRYKEKNPNYFKEYYQERKEEFKERNKRNYLKDKEDNWRNARNTMYKRKYGISLVDYEQMFEEQGGVCAICKQTDARRLAVDHCHSMKKVRGLLCVKCNRALGGFNDDVIRLREAITYLEKQDSSRN